MSTTDTLNIFSRGTSDIFNLSDDVLDALGLFTTKKTSKAIEQMMERTYNLINSIKNSTDCDDEKRVYLVEDIQKILGISRTTAYALIKEAPFRVIRVGNAIRVSKADFDSWLDEPKQRRN